MAGIIKVMTNPVLVSTSGLIAWTEALLAAYYAFGSTLADRFAARAAYIRTTANRTA